MSDTTRKRLFRTKRLRPYRGCGAVYAWLRAHHGQVAGMVASWAWADLVQEMLRDGLQGRDGVTPTPKAVTKVWQRVCRDVEAEANAAPPKRRFPSRMSPDWRPQVVPQLATSSGQTGVPAPAGLPALTTPPLPPVRPPQPPVTKGGAVTPPRRGRPRFIEDRSMFSAEAQRTLAELDDQLEDTDAYLKGF